jgi:PAS domain S-box-containing protein
MNRHTSATNAPRLDHVLLRRRAGIWGAVAMSVVLCIIISWLHLQQHDTLQRTAAAVDTIRQARIDLSQGFLQVTLGVDASSALEREAGLVLLRQAIASIENAVLGAGRDSASGHGFRQHAAEFNERLQRWSSAPMPLDGTNLHIAFQQLEREASRVDADTREQLRSLFQRQRAVFAWALGAVGLVLACICAAVVMTGRGRAASQTQTRRAEQERHDADEALRVSQARFRDTFERAAVGMAHFALDGRFLRVNQQLCDVVGYSREELQSKTVQDITHPEDLAADLVFAERSQAGEISSYSSEKRCICKGGRVVWVSCTGTLIRDGDGGPDYYIAVIEDIQKRKEVEAALRANEEWLRLALSATKQGLFDVDLRTWKVALSPVYLGMLGYSEAELSSYEGIHARRHPEDQQRLDDIYQEYARGERTSHREELRLRNKAGEWIWVASIGQLVERDEAGKPVRVVGTNADITERKHAEETLRNSERRFRALIEHSLDSIAVIDANNHIFYLSPAVETVEGYRPEELIGRSGIENTHPDDLPLVGRIVEQLMANPGKAIPVLWRRRHKDGRWIWLEGFATNLLDDPAVLGIVTNYHDVSERKQAEQALAAERTLLRTLIDALPDVVFTKDTRGHFMICNDAEIRHLGFSREEELKGKTVFDVYPRDLAELYHADDMRAVRGEPVLNREEPSLNAEGKVRWYLTIKVPLKNQADEIIGLVGMSRDITDRKNSEELLRRTHKMEALGTLAGGIAHDFYNILLAISGNTRLAIADLPAEHAAHESLAEIVKASARAAELVRRILSFSRPQEPKRETLRLQPVVEEALKLLRSTLPAMVQIQCDFAPSVPSVSADAGQVHQIMMNLTTNAAHAIGDKVGRIEIALTALTVGADLVQLSGDLRQGRYARLMVSDDGCGMDKRTLERIFDPFFTTKPAGQGTGLGLSVVHGIMRGHDGAVTVYSQPGKGTTFHLYFPAAQSEVAVEADEQRAPPSARGERVLYVDDEPALVQLATRALGRLGYRVTGYDDAAQALQEFQARPDDFDAVVTDLSMPGMSGFELARAVLARRPDIPVVLTSGYVRPQDEETARKIGVRSVILKPNTIDDLGRVLDELLQARAH